MRTTQQFSITLTNEMAEMVRARVASGDYASESEVIREGLRALSDRDRAIESWLTSTAAPALDAMRSDPESGSTIGQVRSAILERQQSR
ncbi:type II toxin-antitoxin system ParD family antitoxin [Enterobacter ludwigii]|uniref:type II toxin-antitoxin system ParD family antitoxin n=1 Tax=Enterobacter ludwigii TaxID=299767 RepID=UPI00041F610C|nr:type II toxin-antitoxin system ParD family antitoxin [Enterobacter ludwigii]KLP39095.1 addiction module antidote protein [Enterobacter ludwigii]